MKTKIVTVFMALILVMGLLPAHVLAEALPPSQDYTQDTAIDTMYMNADGGIATGAALDVRVAYIRVADPHPDYGRTMLARQSFQLEPGETAYSLLRRTGLDVQSHSEPRYVWRIDGLAEFDEGPLSGWKYRVNGIFPQHSSSVHVLEHGDELEWLFTRELGHDLDDIPPSPPYAPPAIPHWFEVASPASAADLISQLENTLEELQNPGDFSLVRRLRVNGSLGASIFNWESVRTALGPYLEELDLSNISGGSQPIVNGGQNAYSVLHRLVLPGGMNSTQVGMFQNNPSLETITWAGNVGTIGSASLPSVFFNNSTSLRELRFYGDTAPIFASEHMFPPDLRQRLIAYVPNQDEGSGYELPNFTNMFSEVRIIGMGVVIPTEPPLDEVEEEEVEEVTFINVPEGARVGVFQKANRHFMEFESFELLRDEELSGDGRTFYRAQLPLGAELHIEAYIPGQTAKKAKFITPNLHGSTYVLSPTPLSAWVPGGGTAWHNAGLYTNLPDSGALNLHIGEVFSLDTFRVWQAMHGLTLNYFIEPEFGFEVFGDSIAISRVGAPGRERLQISAQSPGLSVIRITYGPVEYLPQSGGTLHFDAIDPRNTGLVVVNVGAGGADFDTGISLRNDFDTVYFDNSTGYAQFRFTPPSGSSVRAHAPLSRHSWGSGWSGSTINDDGSHSIRLYEGRNVVEVSYGGSTRYHVVHARGVDVLVENITSPGQPFRIGDTARIRIRGITEPVEKLAGLYNPGFNGSFFGHADLRTYIRYSADGTNFTNSNRAPQYQTLNHDFVLDFRLEDNNVLSGHIRSGWMGDPLGSHRSIPLNGVPNNFNAIERGPYNFGVLPIITLPMTQAPPVEVEATASISITAPDYGHIFLAPLSLPLEPHETAYSLLRRAGLDVVSLGEGENLFIDSIEGLQGFFDEVSFAGWLFYVNGESPWHSPAVHIIQDGDHVEFRFTRFGPEEPELPHWEEVQNRALQRLMDTTGSPVVGSVGGEWAIVALARAGWITQDSPLAQNYLQNLRGSIATIDERRLTEFQRISLALTALGIDASDFEGQNMVAPFATFLPPSQRPIPSQAINTDIFAAIALGSRPYQGDVGAYVAAILAAQQPSGAWGLIPTMPDIDLTAMAITALAPHPGATVAIDRGLAWLSAQNIPDAEGLAQKIVALTALGRDATAQVEALLGFWDESTGGFTRGGIVDAMSTEQAAYALVAHARQQRGASPLLDMRDAFRDAPISDPDQAPSRDLSQLQASISAAQLRNSINYTAASWAQFHNALMAAITTGNNADATQTQIDEATTRLHLAMNSLVSLGVDRTGLASAISRAEGLRPADFTAESFSRLSAALASANATMADTTATQAAIDAAANALDAARLSLTPIQRRAHISVRDPQGTTFFIGQYFELTPGETAYSLLRRTGLNVRSRGNPVYVESINGLAEFDRGPQSGWMYSVNSVFPQVSAGVWYLNDGDRVEWLFTRDLGRDIGGSTLTPQQQIPAPPILESLEYDYYVFLDDIPAPLSVQAALPPTLSPLTSPEDAVAFVDISPESWYYAYVNAVSSTGLMIGTPDGRFMPEAEVSLAMTATILGRFYGLNAPSGQASWYSGSMSWAVYNNLIDEATSTIPGRALPRAELLYLLWLFAGQPSAPSPTNFYDIDSGAHYADAIAWAYTQGITQGRPHGFFDPYSTTTRAEAAAIFTRFSAVYSPDDAI